MQIITFLTYFNTFSTVYFISGNYIQAKMLCHCKVIVTFNVTIGFSIFSRHLCTLLYTAMVYGTENVHVEVSCHLFQL